MKKVVVTDYAFDDLSIERGLLEPLGFSVIGQKKYEGKEKLIALVEEADYVLVQFAPVSAEIINAMKRCRLIVRYGIGYDNVDGKAAAAKNIPLCNIPDFCTDEVADHTLAMILAVTRKLVANWDGIRRDKQWKLAVPIEEMLVLRELTVGLIAYGKIAREVAKRLAPFKCKVMIVDPMIPAATIRNDGFIPATLAELYEQADIISLHCPVTDQTRGMINQASMSRMKRGVVLVNMGRGDLVNGADVLAALQSGHIAAAAMDVTNPEPINMDSPLLAMDNVIVTAHVASASLRAVQYLRNTAANMVVMRERENKLMNVVNGVHD